MGTRREPYKKKQRIDGVLADGKNLKPRRCLGHCDQTFQPLYPGNHVCQSCTEANNAMNGKEYRIGSP